MAALDKLERIDITVDGVTVNVVGGSFKGVPFFVEDYEWQNGGRNVISKSVPFSSNFVNQDLGGKIPTYPLNVYLVGEECKESRDNLIAACNEEGPGELVHPFFGRFQAECVGLTVSGSFAGVNYCSMQIEFRPVSAAEGRPVQTNLAGVTKRAAVDFQNSSVDKFATVFSIVGKGKNIVDNAVKATENAMNVVLSTREVLATANDFVSEIGKIKANAAVIMMAPADFGARLMNLVTATKEMFGVESSGNDVDEYLAMLNALRDERSGENPSGRISSLMKCLVASMVASSLVDAKFVSVDEAAAMQDRITETFEWLLDSVDDVDDYMAISNLQSSSLGYLRSAMEDIAIVLEKDVNYSNNALQLVYDVYGSVDRLEDVLERNSLVQGLFVLPGKLKVLSK